MGEETTIACTLSAARQATRRDELSSGLLTRVEAVEELESGYVLVFPDLPEVETIIGDFIAFEQGCCSFLDFVVTRPAGSRTIELALTGPAGTKELLSGWIAAPAQTDGDASA